MTSIIIRPGGEILSLGELPLELEGNQTRTRVSNILPVNRVKRAAFLMLRLVFGERGQVAAWTRSWSGPWTCTLFHNGETYTHASRQMCVEWEHERLEEIYAVFVHPS